MKKHFLRMFIFLAVMCAQSWMTMTAHGQQIKKNEVKTNLESLNDIDCVKASDMKNIYSPVDLSMSMLRCVQQGRFDDAVFIFALSGVYGSFDTLRVSDQSAHQAVMVLRMATLEAMTPDNKTSFMNQVNTTLGDDAKRTEICQKIESIGAPKYYPQYMVQHGIKALMGNSNGDGLIQHFDRRTGMRSALISYLHCPDNNR
ncbi:hypothetical protein ACO0KY_19105 [Undibacterium sp. Dicai25W]|uniref:hypothetical protein n=1 Tax=Undibacterium sp. Dicai25W TaxID=3413034 RepID=UPI003BF37A36